MSVAARLVSFAALLAAVFGLSLLVGDWSGVDVDTEDEHGHNAAAGPHGKGGHPDAGGYAVELEARNVKVGTDELRFRIVDEQGDAVTAYDERHERDLHLIVVAADNLADYQHLHPELDDDGTWASHVELAPGSYRIYADTQPTGADPLVLESELRVTGGKPVKAPLPPARRVADLGEYAVSLAREGSQVMFTVTRDGEPVTDLEPYLGAFGHLVAIRADDLEYLHAHPEKGPAGPGVTFEVEFGQAGQHALYFEFQHEGAVRTAQFTVGSSSGKGSKSGQGSHGEGGHDH